MAKDGTSRGGARPGSGRKRKAAVDRLMDGQSAVVIAMPAPEELESAELEAERVPPMKEYLTAAQRKGEVLQTKDVYDEMYAWLDKLKCRHVIPPQLVEQYAMSVARWIQCEMAISEYGLLSAHPTTKVAIASPYVSVGQSYMKQANQLWFSIYQTVRENSAVSYDGPTPQDAVMERLLTIRGGGSGHKKAEEL